MSSIRDEPIALDTNQYVFAARGDAAHPACRVLLFERIADLRIYVPRDVIREMHRNLLTSELHALFATLRRAVEVIWDFGGPSEERIFRFQELGARKGDAVIAAHLDTAGIRTLVSENRHFLREIPDLPFEVLTSADVLSKL